MPVSLIFLGSDRLPHCGSFGCAEQVYYSGETIKFLLDVGSISNANNLYYEDENNYYGCGYYQYGPESPYYVEGSHPPIVYGRPKLKFTLNALSGQQSRYARLDIEASNVGQGYLQYNYVIQGTDNGSISVSQSNLIASDGDNRISYWYNCGGMNGGVPTSQQGSDDWGQEELANLSLSGYAVSNVSNVQINADSGSVTENQTRILLKRSSVADKVPTTSDLLLGELAANTTDGKLFLKRGDDSIAKIVPLEPQDFDTNAVTVSADADNLDLGIKALTRLSVTAAGLKISGFKAGKDGEVKMVYNSGSETVKILNESTSSLAANRVAVYNSADFDLPSRSGITIVYDATSGVWRLF